MYTEKIIFNGTPAQFVAVMQEYEIDSKVVIGDGLSFEVLSPLKSITEASTRESLDAIFRGGSSRYQTSYSTKSAPDIQGDTPRVDLSCRWSDHEFYITALIRPDQKTTKLTLRVYNGLEHIKGTWTAIASYMASEGWIDGSEYAATEEPELWLVSLQGKGLQNGTPEWWKEIERMTRQYWAEKGKKALTITRLAKVLCFESRDPIYRNTNLKAIGSSE